MPFTLGGDWYPSENTRKTKPLLSIEKRRNTEVTLIKGLKLMPIEAEALLKTAKRELGCGGSYKDFTFLFQGNHLEKLKTTLREMGFKI
ncbi:MAG: translation initiation factor [Chlamydiia bacterium]|jgi:translation initiation factor 1